MTESKQPKPQTSSPDTLTKSVKGSGVELSESALNSASGGAVFPSSPQVSSLKAELKIDNAMDHGLLLPAVKP
jgi:hypothetical protein